QRSLTPPTGMPRAPTPPTGAPMTRPTQARSLTPPTGISAPRPAAKPVAKPEAAKPAEAAKPEPAPGKTVRSAATTRTPPQGTPRPKKDSVGEMFDKAFAEHAASNEAGVSTAGDLEAVRKVFNDVAVGHVAQVRDVMLELRFGEADPAWMESTRPALRSLH